MLRALYTSASGMQAQQMNLDIIANNLANVNTTGFKKSKIEFQDMLYQTHRAAGADAGGGNQVPTSMQVGHGARAVATSKVFTNGELHQTGDKLDIAIHGNGFFKVTLPDGTDAFSRDGAFKMSNAGGIVTSDGLPVASFAGITIPSKHDEYYNRRQDDSNCSTQSLSSTNTRGFVDRRWVRSRSTRRPPRLRHRGSPCRPPPGRGWKKELREGYSRNE